MLSISKGEACLPLKQPPCPFLQSACNLAAVAAAGNLGKDKINLCANRVQRRERLILIRAKVNAEVFSSGRRHYFRNIKSVYF